MLGEFRIKVISERKSGLAGRKVRLGSRNDSGALHWHASCAPSRTPGTLKNMEQRQHTSLLQHSDRSGTGKILWVACDRFDRPLKEDSEEFLLEAVETPNLDALCRLSETGLIKVGKEKNINHGERFANLTRSRSLAITNISASPAFEEAIAFDHYETVGGLSSFEDVLETEWDSFDFFHLHLDGACKTLHESSDPEETEWIKMVDAWLPGLLAHFQPEVFALSGDLHADHSPNAPILAMLHSPCSWIHSCESLSPRTCRNGRLGTQIDLHQWLLLLVAHASREASYRAAMELFYQ